MSGEFAFTILVIILSILTAINPVRALRAVSWMKSDPTFPETYVRFTRVVAIAICIFNLFKLTVLFLNSK